MEEDEKLRIDEARRIAQHEATKGEVRNQVHAEIVRKADRLDASDRTQADEAAERLRRKAVSEVASTEAEIGRARGVARLSQVVDYIFYLIYGLIALEIVLELIGARESNAFKNFVDAVTAPLLAPFRGLVADPTSGASQFRLSFLVALFVYFLLHLAVNGLLRLLVHKRTTV